MITLRSTTALMFKLKQYKALLQQMPDSSAKMQSLDLVKQVKRKSHLPPCELLPALASLLLELYFTKLLGRGTGIHRHSLHVLNLSLCRLKRGSGSKHVIIILQFPLDSPALFPLHIPVS